MVNGEASGEWRMASSGDRPVARTSGSRAGRTYQRQRGRSSVPASGEVQHHVQQTGFDAWGECFTVRVTI